MAILVTAASGQLGGLVVEKLLARGAQPDELIATARDVSKLAHLGQRGLRVRHLDYADPESVTAALAGVDTMLLVSGPEPGVRVQQHRNVIEAAAAAKVSKLAYTSMAHADTSGLPLAPDHRLTEEIIADSGVPAVILRNNWYTENYAPDLARAAQTGVVAASVGLGRVASASRADYAEAAAVSLLQDGNQGQVYELAGDTAWDYRELAAAMAQVLGRDVSYQQLSTPEHHAALTAAGLDGATADFVTALDASIGAGDLAFADGTLADLIARPATPLVQGLRAVA
ncbi:MAG: SDR family oxidoreductase [Beutenbergiaceae bacterium]